MRMFVPLQLSIFVLCSVFGESVAGGQSNNYQEVGLISLELTAHDESAEASNFATWTLESSLVATKKDATTLVEFRNSRAKGKRNGDPFTQERIKELEKFLSPCTLRINQTPADGSQYTVKTDRSDRYLRLISDALCPPLPKENIQVGDTWQVDRDMWHTKEDSSNQGENESGIRPLWGIYDNKVPAPEVIGHESDHEKPIEVAKYRYSASNEVDWYSLTVYYDLQEETLLKSVVRQWRRLSIRQKEVESLITIVVETKRQWPPSGK